MCIMIFNPNWTFSSEVKRNKQSPNIFSHKKLLIVQIWGAAEHHIYLFVLYQVLWNKKSLILCNKIKYVLMQYLLQHRTDHSGDKLNSAITYSLRFEYKLCVAAKYRISFKENFL